MSPSFRYLIGDAAEPVVPGSSLWESRLPMDRHHFQIVEKNTSSPPVFSHGDYFTVAHRYLEEDGYLILSKVLSPKLFRRITHIDICLMKHGEFYHPARITASGANHRRHFVLNVAVSEPGRRIIGMEVVALDRLHRVSGPSFVPRVYGRGSVSVGNDRVAEMFMGEWFDGYHEFHISSREDRKLCLWGERDLPFPLSREQAFLIYHQASKILTRYYNPENTEHISHWHHAGGDFVVRCNTGRVDVRLITVRSYNRLLKLDERALDPEHRSEPALAALLIFLINLSVRMRLDRLDGIGEIVWADDAAVVATWSGFLEGLSESGFPAEFLPDPIVQFEAYLASYSPADLHDIAEALATTFPVGAEEKAVIGRHLASHMETLIDTISRIGFS